MAKASVHAADAQQEAAKRAPAADVAPAPIHDAAPASAPFDPEAFSTWALTAFADGISGYVGNWPHLAGHVLTYSGAILDLHDLGLQALVRKAEIGLRSYVAFARQTKPWPATVPADVRRPMPRDSRPDLAAFWQEHPEGVLNGSLAHALKYPYSYMQLLRRSTDARLASRLRSCAYVMLDWYIPERMGAAQPD